MNRRNFIKNFLAKFSGGAIALSLSPVFVKSYEYCEKQLRRLRNHTAKRKRKIFLSNPIWKERRLVLNINRRNRDKIIHWPHPAFFKLRYRVSPKNQRIINVEEWREWLYNARFDKGKSGAILEQLALLEMEVYQRGYQIEFYGLEEAKKVLKIALRLEENRNDTRLKILFFRLTALSKEHDISGALKEIVDYFYYSTDGYIPLRDVDIYFKWHQKTVDRQNSKFRKKLKRRIINAKKAV
jgi:hypothetical protein